MVEWYDLFCEKSKNKTDIDEYNLFELISFIGNVFYHFKDRNNNWALYWKRYSSLMNEQNNKGWPELVFTEITTDVINVSVKNISFNSKNLLMMLSYFIYIEKTKNEYRHKNKINAKSFLKCVVRKNIFRSYDNSLRYLINLLKLHMEKYLIMYENSVIESKLANDILDLINDL